MTLCGGQGVLEPDKTESVVKCNQVETFEFSEVEKEGAAVSDTGVVGHVQGLSEDEGW